MAVVTPHTRRRRLVVAALATLALTGAIAGEASAKGGPVDPFERSGAHTAALRCSVTEDGRMHCRWSAHPVTDPFGSPLVTPGHLRSFGR